MSDSTPRPPAWTDAEKASLLFQIIAKHDKIPWDDLQLPPGRTRKACQVMMDREKQKLKATMSTDGKTDASGEESSPAKKAASNKKRKTNGEDKPAKAGRAKKSTKDEAIKDEDEELDDIKQEYDE